MTTDVARYEHHDQAPDRADRFYREPEMPDPTGGRLVAWAHAAHAAKQLGDALSGTSFVPQHFRGKPEDCAAAIMYGDEVGFSPGQALQNIYVVSGKPSLYARAMVALVMSKGHEIWTEASSPQRVIVCGRRRGTKNVERVEWTRAKAEQAGYTSNKKYQSAPEDMLYARASGTVARRVAPDALMGIAYTVEELELGVDNGSATVTITQDQPKRTAQRASAKPPADEPDLDEPELATDKQVQKVGIALRELGLEERADAIAYVVDVIGRDVKSRKEMTKDEASHVIDHAEAELAARQQAADEPHVEDPGQGELTDAFPNEQQGQS